MSPRWPLGASLRAAALVGAVVGLAAPAAAWEPIAGSRPTWVLPAPYRVQSSGSADLGGLGPSADVLREAFGEWTAVACVDLVVEDRGTTEAPPGVFDGTSVVGWLEADWPHSPSAIGVTSARWGAVLLEADVALNGVDFVWTEGDVALPEVDARSLLVHETGHFLGLDHTDVPGAAMWPTYVGGVVGLGPDDEAGICALYPGEGRDCTVDGCPTGRVCEDGVCVPEAGDGSFCAPCEESGDCVGEESFCLAYPDGRFCGRACEGDADCGAPEGRCAITAEGPQCVRFVDGEPSCEGARIGCRRDTDCADTEVCRSGSCRPEASSGAGLAEPCADDGDCRSGACLDGLCTRSCDQLDPASCPDGTYCDLAAGTSCIAGSCVPGEPGGRVDGATCDADTDCAGLSCVDGVCAAPCVPGGVEGCPAGRACQVGERACQGACQLAADLGDPCEVDLDCASRLCVVDEEEAFCSRLCAPGVPEECPARFACEPSGDVGVCVPEAGGLGSPCEGSVDCLSGLCVQAGATGFCSRFCDDEAPCPGDAYRCVGTDDPSRSVGRPGGGGCGCRAVGGRSSPWLAVGAIGVVLLLAARRRRRPCASGG
ncbi:MAG: matrixin family metalloprotease [Sandaracinaceae bacterium]